MFSYIMLGTNDLPRAAFYDPLMAMLGHPQSGRSDEGASWGHSAETAPSDCALADRLTSSRRRRVTA